MSAGSEFFERLKQRPFYPALGVLMIVMAAAGFVPESLRMVRHHTVPTYVVVHVHAVIFAGWLLLFLLQAILAATGRMVWHRRMGNVLFAYAAVMLVAGVWVTINRFDYEVAAGEVTLAQKTNLAPVVDMLVFGPLFCLAWFYRRKPEIHKRLMIVTATMLLYAAVVRINPIRSARHNDLATMAVWSLPILIGMAHDLLYRKAVHRVYLFGLVAVIVLSMRPELEDSTPWRNATTWFAHQTMRHG